MNTQIESETTQRHSSKDVRELVDYLRHVGTDYGSGTIAEDYAAAADRIEALYHALSETRAQLEAVTT